MVAVAVIAGEGEVAVIAASTAAIAGEVAVAATAVAAAAPRRPPPARETGVVAWLRANLFNNIHNSVLTLLAVWALLVTLPGFISWAVAEASWMTDDSKVCRTAAGACWAVIAEKHRVMLFGTFPYDEHWRGVLRNPAT